MTTNAKGTKGSEEAKTHFDPATASGPELISSPPVRTFPALEPEEPDASPRASRRDTPSSQRTTERPGMERPGTDPLGTDPLRTEGPGTEGPGTDRVTERLVPIPEKFLRAAEEAEAAAEAAAIRDDADEAARQASRAMAYHAAAHRLCEIVRERGVWDISYIDEEHLRPHDWYSGHSEMLLFGSRTVDLAKKEKARRYSSDYPYESDGYKESPINEVWAQECLKEINIAPSTQYLFTLKDNVYWNQVLELIFYISQSKKEYIVTYYYLNGEFLWRRADIFSY